jgi:Mor family transcriptional regulator
MNNNEIADKIKAIEVHPDSIAQLESLIENAESFIREDEPDSIWHKDIEVLNNTIEVIKAVLEIKGINPNELRKPQPGPTLFDFVEYKPGQTVVYKKTNSRGEVILEAPGIVKRMTKDGRAAFVWYHTGCTAACTPLEYLHASPETEAHTRLHHGCDECLTGDPEAFMELLFNHTEEKA